MDQIEELSIGFEIDPINRPTARKLDKVDLSKAPNLKDLIISNNTNFKRVNGLENLNSFPSILFQGITNLKAVSVQHHKEWKDAIRNLLGITSDDLPDTWQNDLANKLGGKNLKDMQTETSQTLAGLIANYKSDKNDLQNQLNQATNERDAAKNENNQLKQQLDAIKNQLGVGNNANQQQIIDKIKELQGRPTTSCTHTDYDAIKSERDKLQTQVNNLQKENSQLKNRNIESIKVLTEATNTWGMKFSDKQKQTIQNASTAQEVNEVIKTEVGKLKDKNSSSTRLNIGLGVLTIVSLLLLGWVLMRQSNLPTSDPKKEKER